MGELVKVNNCIAELDANTAEMVDMYEELLKDVKEKYDVLKAQILKEMEEQNVVKLDTGKVSIIYIAPSDRESFDSKAFKKDMPETYDEYVKIIPVKASIRVKVK
jgi:coenzyme F420-reducing hydrogenase alpha subunit